MWKELSWWSVRHIVARPLIGSETLLLDQLFWLFWYLLFFLCFEAIHINLLLTSNKAIAHDANGVTVTRTTLDRVGVLSFSDGRCAGFTTQYLIAYAGFYAWYTIFLTHRSILGGIILEV